MSTDNSYIFNEHSEDFHNVIVQTQPNLSSTNSQQNIQQSLTHVENDVFNLEPFLSSDTSSEFQNKKRKLQHEGRKTIKLFGVEVFEDSESEIAPQAESHSTHELSQTELSVNFEDIISNGPRRSDNFAADGETNYHQTSSEDPWEILVQKFFEKEQDTLCEFGLNASKSHGQLTYEDFQRMWPTPSSYRGVNLPWIQPDVIPPEPTKNPNHCRAQLCTAVGNELWDLSAWLRLTPQETATRNDIISKVTEIALQLWKECEVKVFGSSATNLAVPSSDIDIAILRCTAKTKRYWEATPQDKLSAHLSQANYDWISNLEIISAARVPLIKLHTVHGISVDICFEESGGIKNTEIINRAHEYVPCIDQNLRKEQLRCIVVTLKLLLDQFDLHTVWTGGLGSYCLYLMVLAHMKEFFTKYPHLKNMDENWITGELFMTFLKTYGIEFNYCTHAISVKSGSVPKSIPTGSESLSVIDDLSPPRPDGTQDIGGGCFRFTDVKLMWRVAHYLLSIPSTDQQGNSVETSINCNPYPSFLSRVLDRNHLRRSGQKSS